MDLYLLEKNELMYVSHEDKQHVINGVVKQQHEMYNTKELFLLIYGSGQS